MDIVLGYLAGLLTLINPCVLPVLPIVLASAAQRHRLGPLALACGMAGSFAVLGLVVTAFGAAVGLDADRMAQIGAGLTGHAPAAAAPAAALAVATAPFRIFDPEFIPAFRSRAPPSLV